MAMNQLEVEYRDTQQATAGLTGEALISRWAEYLPYFCRDRYLTMTRSPSDITRFSHGSFEYIYDYCTMCEEREKAFPDAGHEDRLIVAYGRSNPQKCKRDDYRLRGWVGATEKTFGKAWDKGHFIAHSIGGAVDGLEANVFIQRRDLNRGWSEQGKLYRKMEDYCFDNLGTFCFSRPIYIDGSSRPGFPGFRDYYY